MEKFVKSGSSNANETMKDQVEIQKCLKNLNIMNKKGRKENG